LVLYTVRYRKTSLGKQAKGTAETSAAIDPEAQLAEVDVVSDQPPCLLSSEGQSMREKSTPRLLGASRSVSAGELEKALEEGIANNFPSAEKVESVETPEAVEQFNLVLPDDSSLPQVPPSLVPPSLVPMPAPSLISTGRGASERWELDDHWDGDWWCYDGVFAPTEASI